MRLQKKGNILSRDGLLILTKPAGMTSARAVAIVKKLLHGTKVGHAGTLDPFATGVLVLLLGKATRRCEQIMALPKTYDATIKLGVTTATDDIESPEQFCLPEGSRRPELSQIEQALRAFVGDIQQRPPAYSAIKIAGKRACDRVRKGHVVELSPRTVHVESIMLMQYQWPLLRVRIECGRGTYIRSIARDLGTSLGTGGYLTSLTRTRIGSFDLEQAVPLERLTEQNIAEFILAEPGSEGAAGH